MCSYFRKNKTSEEDDLVANGDRLVQISARRPTNILVFIYYICLFIIYQTRELAQMASESIGKAHDLGSNPRSSHFQYHFPIHVHVQRQY